MMGPYMRPMALNVPVAMAMSMLVAFTITPWLAYHVLGGKYASGDAAAGEAARPGDDPSDSRQRVKQTLLYRIFYPLMAAAAAVAARSAGASCWSWRLLTAGGRWAGGHAARAAEDAAVRQQERVAARARHRRGHDARADATRRCASSKSYLAGVPEVTDFTSYVGLASPMDFNGLVRHYYLRQGDERGRDPRQPRRQEAPNAAEPRDRPADAGRARRRSPTSTAPHEDRRDCRPGRRCIATRRGRGLRPARPRPTTICSPPPTRVRAPAAARAGRGRRRRHPRGRAAEARLRDRQGEGRARRRVGRRRSPRRVQIALDGEPSRTVRRARPSGIRLRIELRLPRATSGPARPTCSSSQVRARRVSSCRWPSSAGGRDARRPDDLPQESRARGLRVRRDCRPPAGRRRRRHPGRPRRDRSRAAAARSSRSATAGSPRPTSTVAGRTSCNGSGVPGACPPGFTVDFAGEGEWKITLDVFRDLAWRSPRPWSAIYVLLVAQTGSFAIPLVVMLAIPLTCWASCPASGCSTSGRRAGRAAMPIRSSSRPPA